jgi:hypothetical protein
MLSQDELITILEAYIADAGDGKEAWSRLNAAQLEAWRRWQERRGDRRECRHRIRAPVILRVLPKDLESAQGRDPSRSTAQDDKTSVFIHVHLWFDLL